ncbi:hypothetical protein KA036_02690 [Candidatus Gracilibacteria bacterium]|nr:hypothetical protein [Candidatus Gracilibacteria bacterium]
MIRKLAKIALTALIAANLLTLGSGLILPQRSEMTTLAQTQDFSKNNPETFNNPGLFDLNESAYRKFLPGTTGTSAQDRAQNLIDRIFRVVRLALGSIASIIAIVAAIRLIVTEGSDDDYNEAKQMLVYAVAGICIVALSADIASVFSPEDGGLLGGDAELSQRAKLFDNKIKIVLTFIKYFIGSVAILMLVRIGGRMVALSESEDELGQDKKNLGLIAMGLMMMIFSDYLIRKVLFRVDSPAAGNVSIDIPEAIQQLIGFTNLAISFVGPLAMITLVAGGLMYALSGANEELAGQAKKMIQVSLIGIILIYSGYAIVNTFIIGRF